MVFGLYLARCGRPRQRCRQDSAQRSRARSYLYVVSRYVPLFCTAGRPDDWIPKGNLDFTRVLCRNEHRLESKLHGHAPPPSAAARDHGGCLSQCTSKLHQRLLVGRVPSVGAWSLELREREREERWSYGHFVHTHPSVDHLCSFAVLQYTNRLSLPGSNHRFLSQALHSGRGERAGLP